MFPKRKKETINDKTTYNSFSDLYFRDPMQWTFDPLIKAPLEAKRLNHCPSQIFVSNTQLKLDFGDPISIWKEESFALEKSILCHFVSHFSVGFEISLIELAFDCRFRVQSDPRDDRQEKLSHKFLPAFRVCEGRFTGKLASAFGATVVRNIDGMTMPILFQNSELKEVISLPILAKN